jgi:hypothetical protein
MRCTSLSFSSSDSASRLLDHRAHRGLDVGAPAIDARLSQYAGLPSTRVRIAWLEGDGAIEHPLRLFIVRPGGTVVEQLACEHAFIGREVFRRLALHAVVRRGRDAARQDRDDRRRHLILDGEDVGEFPDRLEGRATTKNNENQSVV